MEKKILKHDFGWVSLGLLRHAQIWVKSVEVPKFSGVDISLEQNSVHLKQYQVKRILVPPLFSYYSQRIRLQDFFIKNICS